MEPTGVKKAGEGLMEGGEWRVQRFLDWLPKLDHSRPAGSDLTVKHFNPR